MNDLGYLSLLSPAFRISFIARACASFSLSFFIAFFVFVCWSVAGSLL